MDLVALSVTGVLVVLAVVTRYLVDRVGPGNRTRPDDTCPSGWGHHPRHVDPVPPHADRSTPWPARTQARRPEAGKDVTPYRAIVAAPADPHRDHWSLDPPNGRLTRLEGRLAYRAVTAKHVTCTCPTCPARGAWWPSHAAGPGPGGKPNRP